MATDPQFASTVLVGVAALSAAEASRTAPSAAVVVVTAGASGSKVEEVVVQATVTTTTGTVRLFLYDGTTYYLWDEIGIGANTVSATNPAYRASRTYTNLLLPNGWSLRAATEKAETFRVIALGGSY